jgi:periplasmic nitrate reductase NapE
MPLQSAKIIVVKFVLKNAIPYPHNGCSIDIGRAFVHASFLSHAMTENTDLRKAEETRSFLFLTVVMVPVLTVALIAVYGFIVWFYQILVGGPPHH